MIFYRNMTMEHHAMQDEDFATALRALGHPVRLSILRILGENAERQCCCTDVTQCLPLAQSTVSQHIKVLLDAGLVERVPRGTRNCYVLHADRLAALHAACSELLGRLAAPTSTSFAREKEPA